MLPLCLMKTEGFVPSSAPEELKTKFDHAGTLPRKASLANPDEARVYFIAGAGLIKIGITTNVPSRLRAIRNSSPVPVELLGMFRGNIGDEMDAHSRFKELRRHGEWFEDTPALREYLADKLSIPLRRPDCPTSWWADEPGCEALAAGFRR
jgi:hypothetical protein